MKKTHTASNVQMNLFTKGDPLTYLLKKKLKLPIWFIIISAIVLLNVPVIIAAKLNSILFSTSSRVGLLNDYSWWFLQLTSVPATVFYFFWLPDGILGVVIGLKNNKALMAEGNDDSDFDNFLEEFDRTYSHWAWVVSSSILIIIFMFFFSVPEQRTFVIWQTSSPFLFWYTIFFWAFFFFLGLLGVIRVIIAILWFNRLFKRFRVDVRVLHPDGAGGLSPLGEFSVKIGYLIGIYGVASVSATLSESYITTTKFAGPMLSNALIPLLLVYVILAPIVFFAPIGAARSAMKAAKNEFILQIADQFEIETRRLQSFLVSDSNELKKSLERIEQLQKIHSIATKFPVWPFNVENIIRFFSAISSPFVLGIISLVIDLVK